MDENDYILESLFEKQLNEIIDFQCQEDPSIDIGEIVMRNHIVNMILLIINVNIYFSIAKYNSDTSYSTIQSM